MHQKVAAGVCWSPFMCPPTWTNSWWFVQCFKLQLGQAPFHQYRSTRSNWGCSHCGEALGNLVEGLNYFGLCVSRHLVWFCLLVTCMVYPDCSNILFASYLKRSVPYFSIFQVSTFLWKMGCDSRMDTPCPQQARAVQFCGKPKSFEPSFPVYLTGTTEVYWTGCVVLFSKWTCPMMLG